MGAIKDLMDINSDDKWLNARYYRLIILGLLFSWLLLDQNNAFCIEKQSVSSEDRESCLYESGETAQEACERILEVTPQNLSVLLKQADHLIDAQRLDEANMLAKEAKKHHPSSKKAAHKLEEIESYYREIKWA